MSNMKIKIPTGQDCFYKWAPKKSGETSINISKEIATYIFPGIVPGTERPISFLIYKEDYLKAIGYIINSLPLYTSTSKNSTKIVYSTSLFTSQINRIFSFFGEKEVAEYKVNLKYREDGRCYLNDLENNNFNVREYLVEYFTTLTFEFVSDKLHLRTKLGPIGTNVAEMDSAERREAFCDYIKKKKTGRTIDNYIDVVCNPSRGEVIYKNMKKLEMPGMLYDYTDIAKIQILYLEIIGDPQNASFHQTYSAAVNCYKEFLLSFFELPQAINETVPTSLHHGCPAFQKIFFGTPGGGKSHKVKEIVEKEHGAKTRQFRTTFHPDTDYASFVGSYKPVMEGKEIIYQYVPQVFTEAYIAAWNDPHNSYFLIIEEINRGNCAQIFGDLFQLLDRKEGVSEYPIQADADLRKYLQGMRKLEDGSEVPVLNEKGKEGIKNGRLCLPSNLSILATMNTSDQSLFPMDSAFKRRWDWEYVPSTINAEDNFDIEIGGLIYKWHAFRDAVNERIFAATESEDKQLGSYFIKNNLNEDQFKSKVMFYLWSEICKEEYGTNNNFFRVSEKQEDGQPREKEFTFNSLFGEDATRLLQEFMTYLKLEGRKQEGQIKKNEEAENLLVFPEES